MYPAFVQNEVKYEAELTQQHDLNAGGGGRNLPGDTTSGMHSRAKESRATGRPFPPLPELNNKVLIIVIFK